MKVLDGGRILLLLRQRSTQSVLRQIAIGKARHRLLKTRYGAFWFAVV